MMEDRRVFPYARVFTTRSNDADAAPLTLKNEGSERPGGWPLASIHYPRDIPEKYFRRQSLESMPIRERVRSALRLPP